MRLDLKRHFKIPPGLCKTLEAVCGSCQVCHAVKTKAGNADETPLTDVPMESVAIDKFTKPPVRQDEEVYHCVILCFDRHSGYLVAVPARDKGIKAEVVAGQMISDCVTVLSAPKAFYSDNRSDFTGSAPCVG